MGGGPHATRPPDFRRIIEDDGERMDGSHDLDGRRSEVERGDEPAKLADGAEVDGPVSRWQHRRVPFRERPAVS